MRKRIILLCISLISVSNIYSQFFELNFDDADEKVISLSEFQFKIFPIETNLDCIIGQISSDSYPFSKQKKSKIMQILDFLSVHFLSVLLFIYRAFFSAFSIVIHRRS